MKINYDYYREFWHDTLISFGFDCIYNDHECMVFKGLEPKVRIEVYTYYAREDTFTHGCIAGDFDSTWNKISQCPIYFDLTIDKNTLKKAIRFLINKGFDFSNHCGKIQLSDLSEVGDN